jgi:hypothetical protein
VTTIEEVLNGTTSFSLGNAMLTLAKKAAPLGFIDFIVTATPKVVS